jgi:multidrug resistance efflux pump
LVERVAVRDGERVERGQVLIELGNDRLRWERIEVERELELARFALSLLEAGERPERIARANAALEASSSRARWARMNAERASALTSLGSRSQDEADRFGIAAAVLDAESTAASERLAHLRAGARLEDLEAARSFVAELAARHEAIAEAQRRLLIVSPIAGTVVRPHVEDLLHTRVRPGQVLLELHDRDAAYAEIRLFRGQVLNPFAPGTPAVVRLYGDPGHEIETEIALVRATSDPELLATTAIFENTRGWVDGAAGHARIYGERRTLAHQFVAVPILQVLRYSVWRVRGD